MRRAAFLAAMLAALIASAPAAANVHVSRGQTVNEIRVIGQDVTVDGVARGPVIVIGGNLSIGPHGEAANITVIAGTVRAAPGSRLRDDVFQFGGPTPELNGWLLVAALLGFLALRTGVVFGAVALGRRLAESRYQTSLSAAASDRHGRLLAAGILAAAGLLALSVICLLSIAGLLITLIIWGFLLIGLITGIAALAEPIREMRLQRATDVLVSVPLIGDALLSLALVVGVGVLLRRLTTSKAAPSAAFAGK